MKYMILLYDNADMREIFSSRSDLMQERDRLLEEIRQSGELVATEPLADLCRPRQCARPTARLWSRTGRSPRPRNTSAAT